MRRRLGGVVAVALALVAGACGSGGEDRPPPSTAPPTTEAPATTAAPATTVPPPVTVPGAPRVTTTIPLGLGPGEARIAGTVVGPEGPLTGATVRVERLVGQAVAGTDVRTAGGAWAVDSVLGGSYRVRAFRPPDLAQLQPEVFFLAASETKQLALRVVRLADGAVTAIIDPNPPVVGEPAVLTVRLTIGSVDADGKVSTSPQPAQRLQLAVGAGFFLESSPVAITDSTGTAVWRLRCQQPGTSPVSLVFATGVSAVSLPPCSNTPPPSQR